MKMHNFQNHISISLTTLCNTHHRNDRFSRVPAGTERENFHAQAPISTTSISPWKHSLNLSIEQSHEQLAAKLALAWDIPVGNSFSEYVRRCFDMSEKPRRFHPWNAAQSLRSPISKREAEQLKRNSDSADTDRYGPCSHRRL